MLTVPAIDVSQYQGRIDWPQVAAAGIKLAICRVASPSGKIDPTGVRNLTGSTAAGLTSVPYVVPRRSIPAAQTVAKLDGLPTHDTVMIDLEPGVGFYEGAADGNQLHELIVSIKARGLTPWLYGPTMFINQFGLTGADIPQIVPRYPRTGVTPPSDPAGWYAWAHSFHRLPQGPANGCWLAGWQFSSDGQVPGIAARCDLNLIDPRLLTPTMKDDDGMPVIYNDTRYLNRWLVSAGGAVHLSPALFAHYKAAGAAEISDRHDQTLRSVMFLAGTVDADLVAA